MNQRKSAARIFWLGFMAALACTGFLQDWYGKEGYIEFIRDNWVNTHWSMYLLIVALAYVVYLHLLNKYFSYSSTVGVEL